MDRVSVSVAAAASSVLSSIVVSIYRRRRESVRREAPSREGGAVGGAGITYTSGRRAEERDVNLLSRGRRRRTPACDMEKAETF